MRKKLRDSGGLTMVEMLCAVAILVLLCLMMNTGLSLAVKSYRDITVESETQLLLSSLTDALSDKLRYCVVTKTVKTESGSTTTTYGSSVGAVVPAGDDTTGVISGVSLDSSDKILVDGKPLLPGGAYGKEWEYRVEKLDSGDDIVTYTAAADGTVTFTIKLKVTAGNISASTPETGIIVRCLNPMREKTE